MRTTLLVLLFVMLVTTVQGADAKDKNLKRMVTKLVERQKIVDVVNTLYMSTDAKDWHTVANLFTNDVHFDVRSMGAKAVEQKSGDDIAKGWQEGLKSVDQVFHQSGNFIVKQWGSRAEVNCYAIATHYLPKTDFKERTFVGSYEYGLVKVNGQWKINKFVYRNKYIHPPFE